MAPKSRSWEGSRPSRGHSTAASESHSTGGSRLSRQMARGVAALVGLKPSTNNDSDEMEIRTPEGADLQVLAFRDVDELDGSEIYRVPSFFDEPGATISAVVRAELLNEVRRHRDEETVERITHLLRGIFQGVEHAQEVYRGYLDDPRNTDNAWVETTVYHHHFSRELGGLLPFGHKACRAIWVSIYDRKLRISNPQWIQTVQKFIEYEFSRPGLLQLVVRWGRNDIAQMVLNDKELADQRQATHVQRALQDALERAKEVSFDAQSLVDLLIEHGAEAAGIFLPDLFRNMRNDSFGFCDELRNNKFNKDRTRTLWQD